MADNQGGNSTVMREYRKGNWTVNETMVLVEAKKMDDERRLMKKISGDHSEGRGVSKPAGLRWKWVEDYCWRKGCLRSQNQCNDKWDNLMREFKKVRDYQRKIMGEKNVGSYWEMEKNERKEKNFPSNMLREIYERLEEVVAVVEKQGGGGQRVVAAAGGGGSGGHNIPNITYVLQPSLPLLLQHHQLSAPIPASIPLAIPAPPPLLPPPTAVPAALEQTPPLSYTQPLPTLDSDTSEYLDSPAKRKRRAGNREGTDGGGGTASNSNDKMGTAISKSASIIAEAIQASDEREEKRHKDLVSLHERRLKIEESKTEINKRAIDGLVDAINKLANSIIALASSHKNQSAPK